MKRFNMLITLIMVCLGGFIGFDPNSPSQTANAEETRIRWVDVPKMPVDVLGLNEEKSINIDLQEKTVLFNGNADNTTVTIKTDVETRPEYITKVVEKVVYLPEDIAYRSKFFNRLKPINKELPVKNW